MTEFFNEEITLFQQEADSAAEALKSLAEVFQEKNLVTTDFYQNIIKREEAFPTGLDVNGIGVALPHTDSEYVHRSQVGFLSLKEPVKFFQMGTTDQPVEVKILFMLALKEPHQQLTMLQNLIEMFQKEDVLQQLLAVDQTADYLSIIHESGLY